MHFDLDVRPFIVIWELTRACRLACVHCRAESVCERDPHELTTAEGMELIDQIASFGHPRPMLILTGGDPCERPDLEELVAHGRSGGLSVSIAPSVTPLLTQARLGALRSAGAGAVSISLDGSTAEVHDRFRQVPGSHRATLAAIDAVREAGFRLMVNTTVSANNLEDLADIAARVCEMGAATWNVFFLVPTGRAAKLAMLDAGIVEEVLGFCRRIGEHVSVKVTEAPQYRRVVLHRSVLGAHHGRPSPVRGGLEERLVQRFVGLRGQDEEGAVAEAGPGEASFAGGSLRRSPLDVRAAKGFAFVSHVGEVYPSGFLPLAGGNLRETPLPEIYRGSAVFRMLRDPDLLRGRCGVCELRDVCGGSRARAYGMTGDPFAEEPWCGYRPGSFPFPDEVEAMLERRMSA